MPILFRLSHESTRQGIPVCRVFRTQHFPAHRETHIDTLAGKKHAPLTGAVNPIDDIHQGFAVRAGGTFIKHQHVAIVNPGVFHAVTFHTQKIGCRGMSDAVFMQVQFCFSYPAAGDGKPAGMRSV